MQQLLSRLNKPTVIIFVFVFFVITLWVAFYPKFYANVDEHNYLRTSWKIARSDALYEDQIIQNLGGFENEDGFFISKYNIGNSIWLVPGTFISDIPFFMSLFCYLMLVAVCYEILRELKMNKYWIIGIILFPAFLFFSRTLLSEIPAALFVALSYLSYLRKDKKTLYKFILGASLGFMVLIRYNLAIWVILVMLVLVKDYWRKPLRFLKKYWQVFLMALPFLITLVIINLDLYGGILASGYKFSGEEKININLFLTRFPKYLILLNIIYPAQLFIFPLSKKPLIKPTIIFVAITLSFYSVAGGFLYDNQIRDIVLATRFFVPLMPLILIHYFSVLENKTGKYFYKLLPLLIIPIAALLIANSYMIYKHQQLINERFEKYKQVNKLISADTLFIGSEEDFMYFGEHLNNKFNNSGYLDIKSINPITIDLLSMNREIYLLEIKYSSRSDRPTQKMTETIDLLDTQGKIKLITKEKNINIYKYNAEN